MKRNKGLNLFLTAVLVAGLVLIAGPLPLAQAATTWYVDDDNCPGPGSGTAGDPYCKIQDAITAASAGDTINVAAGTYTEYNIAVNKQLTFLGAKANIDPRSGARAWNDAGESRVDADNLGDGFVVTADSVVINGFTVINAATGGTFDTAHPGRGIFIVESSNCEVKYNVAYNNTYRGIRIWSDTADAANNSVHHNLCYTSDSSVDGRVGISVSGPNTHHNTIDYNEGHTIDTTVVPSADAHHNTIRYNNCHDSQRGISLNWGANNNTVEYNTITNNSEGGISHSGPGGGWGAAHHNIVRNNTLDGNGGADDAGGHGIGLSTDCHDNLIENNTITNSGDFGINLHKAVDNIIRGNTVNNSGRIGISVWDNCTGNVVEDNDVNGTRRHQGIKVAHWSVTGCDNNTIRDNEVQNATSHGIFVYYATNTTITGNTVHDNGGDGIKIGNDNGLEVSDTTTVNCNSVYDNTGFGVNNHHYDGGVPPLLDAENNWWGDASGPTHASNPGGSGDAVTDNVDFDPWSVGTPPCESTITIVKDASPDDSHDFDFSGDLGNFSLDDDADPTLPNSRTFTRDPGTYNVAETVPAAWNLNDINCTTNDPNDTTAVNVVGGSVTIDLDSGEDITCTFTNAKKTVQTGTGTGTATFDVDAGVMEDLTAVAEDALTCPADSKPSIEFPHGLFAFNVTGLTPCASQTVEVTVTLPDPAPVGTQYWKCQNGQWVQIPIGSDNGDNVITFQLTDGGQGDGDGVCNGEIIDPGGPAYPLGTIIVEKQTDPDGAAGTFTFSGDAAGAISDDGQIVVSNLDAGTYTATEDEPGLGFELTNITCNDGDSTGNVGTRTATFNVDWGETVKCTFTNAMRSLKVTKQLESPVGGLAAIDQVLRFNITIENDGGLTIDPLTLRDDYDPWCMISRRAELPPNIHGGGQGFLQWNNLGALAPGESLSLWVEFTAAHACQEATNRAIVQTGGLSFEDKATLRILDTIARVGGFVYHDDNGGGTLNLPCRGTDVDPAGCQPGLEFASAETTLPSGKTYHYTTNTAGWFSFNLLDPATYHVLASPPVDSWWTPTTAEVCDATVINNWDHILCHFGYWWGLDGPPVQAAAVAANQITLYPTQDATISEWEPGNHGLDKYVPVRQPGVASTLLQFDLSTLPEGADIVWAKLRLYGPFASNYTNRLYMTAYPLDKAWLEHEVTWLQAAAGTPWSEPGATADHSDPIGWAWIDTPGWVEFDLDIDLLANDCGFLLRGEGSDNREVSYWFFSREYLNPDVQPKLIVGYDVP